MEQESLGIMSDAYRVSRKEILEWINNTLELHLEKIEQLGTAAVYCQLFEAHFPGSIQMKSVNWLAKSEHEFVQNFKLLQKGFVLKQFKKAIDVKKLVACKYQDNLEFIQWMKSILTKYGKIADDYNPRNDRNVSDLLYLSKNPQEITKQHKANKDTKLTSNPPGKVYIPGESSKKDKDAKKPKVSETKPTKIAPVEMKNEVINQLRLDLQHVKDVLKRKVDKEIIVKELRNYFMIDVSDDEHSISHDHDEEED